MHVASQLAAAGIVASNGVALEAAAPAGMSGQLSGRRADRQAGRDAAQGRRLIAVVGVGVRVAQRLA